MSLQEIQHRYYSTLIKSAQYYTITFYGELLDCPKEIVQDYFEQKQDIQFSKAFMFWKICPADLQNLCFYVVKYQFKNSNVANEK